MSRPGRLFEIIQMLRSSGKPLTAAEIANRLEVAKRTIYRDIATLQARRVPIEGEAGIGYVMRTGYDLPPLNFDEEEIEAIVVGLSLIGRTRDRGLRVAAARAGAKIAAVVDQAHDPAVADVPLYVSAWTEVPDAEIDVALVRRAIREHRALAIGYADNEGRQTRRTILPLALVYYVEAVVLAAWCNLRGYFRHFRLDRILTCVATGENFAESARRLHRQWHDLERT